MKSKPVLTYLWEADFTDGTTLHQTADDQSSKYPPDENGNGPSAFIEVEERITEVVRFHLVGPSGRWTVDLQDGHFEHNGRPFWVSQSLPVTPGPRRLKFHRTVTFSHHTQGGHTTGAEHVVTGYYVGWSSLNDGAEIVIQ